MSAELIAMLRAQRARVIKELRVLPLWQEYRVIKRMLSELETAAEREQQEAEYIPLHEQGKFTVDGPENALERDRASGGTMDMSNSPARDVPHGQRVAHMYDVIEEVVKAHGGEATFEVINEYLREVYAMRWDDGLGREMSRITSYVSVYNAKHPDDQRLAFWPAREEGRKRAKKYLKIIYIGGEVCGRKVGVA